LPKSSTLWAQQRYRRHKRGAFMGAMYEPPPQAKMSRGWSLHGRRNILLVVDAMWPVIRYAAVHLLCGREVAVWLSWQTNKRTDRWTSPLH